VLGELHGLALDAAEQAVGQDDVLALHLRERTRVDEKGSVPLLVQRQDAASIDVSWSATRTNASPNSLGDIGPSTMTTSGA
jgi:hypothetical protein